MELEREIFEWTARAHCRSAVNLALVGKRFQGWCVDENMVLLDESLRSHRIEPIIYETVVLDYPIVTTTLFLRTLKSRPAGFFAQNVKNIYLTSMIPFPQAQKVLSICTGASNIACWADPDSKSDGLMPLLRTRPLERLSTKLQALCRIETMDTISSTRYHISLGTFANLSHIDIVNPPGYFISVDWAWLRVLPALTHLAFGDLFSVDHLHMLELFGELLAQCKFLQTLVVISHDEPFIMELEKNGFYDLRLVLLPSFHYPKSLRDYWEGVRQGGPDFWELADQTIQKAKLRMVRRPPHVVQVFCPDSLQQTRAQGGCGQF